MIIPLNLELHAADDLDERQRSEARRRASDMDTLGVDYAPATDATFPEVLAHLVMFDPSWLFRQRWIHGWTADDPNAA